MWGNCADFSFNLTSFLWLEEIDQPFTRVEENCEVPLGRSGGLFESACTGISSFQASVGHVSMSPLMKRLLLVKFFAALWLIAFFFQ